MPTLLSPPSAAAPTGNGYLRDTGERKPRYFPIYAPASAIWNRLDFNCSVLSVEVSSIKQMSEI